MPLGWVKSEPPVDTSTIRSLTTRRSMASAPGISLRYRHAANSVMWRCMLTANAVEAQCLAISAWASATWAIVAPLPPSSAGTASAR